MGRIKGKTLILKYLAGTKIIPKNLNSTELASALWESEETPITERSRNFFWKETIKALEGEASAEAKRLRREIISRCSSSYGRLLIGMLKNICISENKKPAPPWTTTLASRLLLLLKKVPRPPR